MSLIEFYNPILPLLSMLVTTLLLVALAVLTILYGFCVKITPFPQYNQRIQSSWRSMASSALAAHVYYLKRTARCRRGRSPESSSDGSFVQRKHTTLSSGSFNTKSSGNGIQKLRAWSSFNN